MMALLDLDFRRNRFGKLGGGQEPKPIDGPRQCSECGADLFNAEIPVSNDLTEARF